MFSYPFSRGCGELALCGGSAKQSFQTKGLYIYCAEEHWYVAAAFD